jgi:arylsulfatase A-like enzyme
MYAVDIVPTIYELLGVDPPDVLNGWTQYPTEGQSFAAALANPEAPGREMQFYSMLGDAVNSRPRGRCTSRAGRLLS